MRWRAPTPRALRSEGRREACWATPVVSKTMSSLVQPGTAPGVALAEEHDGAQAGLLEAGGEEHREIEAGGEAALEDVRSGVRIFWLSVPKGAGGSEYWRFSAAMVL